VCRDFHTSEDVAQEAFVTGWKQLAALRGPSGFRPWICGIARNVAKGRVRKNERRGDHPGDGECGEVVDAADSPAVEAMSGEELELVRRTMDSLDEIYREPLVLFYRENQSVAAVASALEISEDSVRQRLARGRAMLREKIALRIEATFLRTRPGAAFTAGVMGALPPIVAGAALTLSAGTAKAAGLSSPAQAAGGGGIAAASAIAAPVATAVISGASLLVLIRYLRSPHVPVELRRFSINCIQAALASSAIFCVLVIWLARSGFRDGEVLGMSPAALLASLIVAFVAFNVVLPAVGAARLRRKNISFSLINTPYCYRYQSRLRLLGLPLVSIAFGPDSKRGQMQGVAKGWFAFGSNAYGLVAVGGFAAGGIAIGGVCVGAVALGGVTIGALAMGGAAIGVFACGATALATHLAVGCVAVAYHIAIGGIAAAREFAFGGAVSAQMANNGAEWVRLTTQTSLGTIMRLIPHAAWLSLLGIPGLYVAFREIKRGRL
jgi:RNA polymerase sigma factor (sigma-70 family)